jgi:hypothetical protein
MSISMVVVALNAQLLGRVSFTIEEPETSPSHR